MPKKDLKELSVYLSYILRHNPDDIELDMDEHGWVIVQEMIDKINTRSQYRLDLPVLQEIVRTDNKGRYRFNSDETKIKACQRHSIPWVHPELTYKEPPEFLYHGTTTAAFAKIKNSGAILKMKRHAVHLQEIPAKAWQSAVRWRLTPAVLKIDSQRMFTDGFQFGITENDVWCVDSVPVEYIVDTIYHIE